MLQKEQRSLEEREQQLTDAENRVSQTEDQLKLLKEKLSQLELSSQSAALKTAELLKSKDELEIELAIKEERKERLLSQKPYMTDLELALQMIDEVQLSIEDIMKQIALLKMKIEAQNIKQNGLKEETAKKQKEVDSSERVLQASRKTYSLLRSKLNAERIVFDFKLRQQQLSSEKIQEELKVGLIQHNDLYITHTNNNFIFQSLLNLNVSSLCHNLHLSEWTVPLSMHIWLT